MKFWVNWPFCSGGIRLEIIRFSRWPAWWPSWISKQNNFSCFWSTSHPDTFNQVSRSIVLRVQEKKFKIDFQDDSHLEFPIQRLKLVLVYKSSDSSYQVPVNWPFGSEEEVQNRFSRLWLWQPSWISDLKDFSYFSSTSWFASSYQVSCQLAFPFRRGSKYIFKMAAMADILDFQSEWC